MGRGPCVRTAARQRRETRERKGASSWGILYQAADPLYWVIFLLFILFALMAFNELGRTSLWAGIALFAGCSHRAEAVFVWPITAAPGNEYGTGTWFNWSEDIFGTCRLLGFMALRFVKWRGADATHHLYEKRWALCFPPLILAVNIAEAVVRDFQVFSFGLWQGGVVENLWTMSGPWNIMNGIAGILNIVTICGWFGIFISKDSSKDMIWPRHDLGVDHRLRPVELRLYVQLHLRPLGLRRPRAAAGVHYPHVLHQEGRLVAASRADAGAVDHVRDDRFAVRRCWAPIPHHALPSHGVLRGQLPGASRRTWRWRRTSSVRSASSVEPAQGLTSCARHEVVSGASKSKPLENPV